jgi:hypothetical protein
VRQTTKETQRFVSRSSDSQPVNPMSRWGTCKVSEFSTNSLSQQVGYLSTTLFNSTKSIFCTKEARSQPSQTCRYLPHLGSYPVTPNHLEGKPPRVINASMSCRRESQVLNLWDALVNSRMLTQDHSLNPTLGCGLTLTNLIKRWLRKVSLALASQE